MAARIPEQRDSSRPGPEPPRDRSIRLMKSLLDCLVCWVQAVRIIPLDAIRPALRESVQRRTYRGVAMAASLSSTPD
jgi:hypothetical protein